MGLAGGRLQLLRHVGEPGPRGEHRLRQSFFSAAAVVRFASSCRSTAVRRSIVLAAAARADWSVPLSVCRTALSVSLLSGEGKPLRTNTPMYSHGRL